jgi:Na+-transporting methylmalonyl-CoA/oxaloacetate decarboxylase gamma subunit
VSLAYRLRSIRRTLLAAVVLTAAGVVLVWLFMFLLAHG